MSAIEVDRARRTLITPEGVDLRLRLADLSQRGLALLIDLAIIVAALILVSLVCALVGVGAAKAAGFGAAELMLVVWLLLFFFLRNLYFTTFELTPAAATPGKRLLGIRVASRDGGRLRPEAVFARNAMREIELYLPISLLVSRSGADAANGWIYLAGFGWALIFVLLPFFNRDRLRAGDLVGGTWVVRSPRQALLRDMADDGAVRLAHYAFAPAQLDAYGVHELHVLEDVLRARDRATLRAVAERVARKIGWEADTWQDDHAFLSAYYAGLRGRLEGRLLMGVRRRDKHDISKT